jgi:hypothetical protein
MFETLENALTPDDIEWFKADFEKLINVNPVDRPYSSEESQEIYGITATVIDRRHIHMHDSEGHRRMRDIINRYVPPDVTFYMAYQRQFLPHQLHVDRVPSDQEVPYAKSAIIPLSENINGIFKTIVWNHRFSSNKDLEDYIQAFIADRDQFPIISDVSQMYDVDHCWKSPPFITDTMSLAGIYDYKLGSIGLFDQVNLHCSSNWLKYKVVDHKDIILLHIG